MAVSAPRHETLEYSAYSSLTQVSLLLSHRNRRISACWLTKPKAEMRRLVKSVLYSVDGLKRDSRAADEIRRLIEFNEPD